MTYQLTGTVPRTGRGPGPGVVLVALVALALAASGVHLLRKHRDVAASTHENLPAPPTESSLSRVGSSFESADLFVHVGHLERKLEKMGEKTRRAQDLLRQVSRSINRTAMDAQVRRLESADAHLERVRVELVASEEELAMITDHLRQTED